MSDAYYLLLMFSYVNNILVFCLCKTFVSYYNSNTDINESTYESCGSCGGSGRQTYSTCSGEYNIF
jgi:hypothetical protein